MNRDPFGHRKYHGLYFILGFLIAFVAFMMLSGCEQGKTTSGKDCWGMAGMTYEGDQCEVIVDRPPTDPPGCWYPYNEEFCEPEPPRQCCMALTPQCMAQCEGIPVDEWVDNTCGTLAIDVEYGYWDEINNKPVWLCKAEIIN